MVTVYMVAAMAIASINALSLGPPQIGVAKRYDTRFEIDGPKLMSQLQVLSPSGDQFALQQTMLSQIAKEITVLADSEASIVRNTWTFQITPNYATLDYVVVNVNINNNRQAHITGGVVRMNQHIDQQYRMEERCARTGGRRYGICGPRDMECSYHHVARGLDQNEINQVGQHLISHLPAARKMIS